MPGSATMPLRDERWPGAIILRRAWQGSSTVSMMPCLSRSLTHIGHPIGNLILAQASGGTELLHLILAGVWVIRVTMQPVFQNISDRFGNRPRHSPRANGW